MALTPSETKAVEDFLSYCDIPKLKDTLRSIAQRSENMLPQDEEELMMLNNFLDKVMPISSSQTMSNTV